MYGGSLRIIFSWGEGGGRHLSRRVKTTRGESIFKLVPRVSRVTAPSSLVPGGRKMGGPGNEVDALRDSLARMPNTFKI